MVSDNYVSLHTHSEHSQLDGFSQVEAIAHRASSLGQSAVALTDHQECSGHIELEKACRKEGIKPIYGMEGYLVNNIAETRAAKTRHNSHFCVFAENQIGLKNLWSLSSMTYIKGFYNRALADWDMLREYKNGLIVTDGCMLADMSRFIVEDKEDEALRWASKYLEVFGEENFFMELHTWQFVNPQREEDIQLNKNMTKTNLGKIEIANRLGIPLIVVNDAHYSNEEDWEHHALFWTLRTDETDRLDNGKTAAWIMSSDEVRFWMSKHGVPTSITDQAIANTALIADRCNVEIERKLHVPVLTKTKEEDIQLFVDTVEKGFNQKVVKKGFDIDVAWTRVEKESTLIFERELPGYFNIVSDLTQHAKNKGWLLAAGRGSAGGSEVAYLMNITELDPIRRELLFERFLNPGRLDYPDIDIDIPQSKRQDMIAYAENKYGEDKVCRIGTFGRLGPKQVLNDLCRVMDIPFADHKAMTKIIEQVEKIQSEVPEEIDENSVVKTWEEILETKESDLTPWVKKYPLLFIRMQNMIGLIRQSGTHASGIIISDESLIGLIPLRKKKDQPVTTQFDMYTLADMGFIKFDFLGVRNLDTLMEARSLVTGQQCDPRFFYDFDDAEYGDPKIWEPIGRGETVGVFQMNTPAGTQLAKKIKPQNEYEVATLISVDRPGVTRVAGMTDEFVERRKGLRDIVTPHPFMTELLEDTYGIVVYQEQVLAIVQRLAGYSLEEADQIRAIVGKKKMDKMREEKPRFIRRCCENPEFVRLAQGRAAAKAEQCWNQIEQSGSYAFNKAHALGYSLLSCWGAWMKHYYPLQYLTACLMTDPDNLTTYVRDLKRIGFQVLPPDINQSSKRFAIVNGAVRYGLQDLKWVGAAALTEIEMHRPFTSLGNFLALVNKRACNKRVVETLIKIGAFDSMGDRYSLMRELYQIRKEKEFIIPDFQNPAVIQEIELDIVGNYITEDPLDKYRDAIDSRCLKDPDEIDDLHEGEVVEIGGVLNRVHEHNAKNGLMAFLDVEWEAQKFSVVCFADSYRDNKSLLQVDSPVIIRAIRGKKGVYFHNVIRLDYVTN